MPQQQQAESGLGSDIALVRQTLMRELETINAYETFARGAASDEVRLFLAHLASEEKEHVAEATALMRRLDLEQDALFEQERGAEHFAGGAHGQAREAAADPAGAPAHPGFTVGSLRPRR